MPACMHAYVPATTADPQQVALPEARLFEWSGKHGPEVPLKDLIHVISEQEAAMLFASDSPGSAEPGGSRQLLQQQQQQQRQQEEEEQPAPPGGSRQVLAAAGGEAQWRFRLVELAVVLQPFLLPNYWHSMDGGWRARRLPAVLGAAGLSDGRAGQGKAQRSATAGSLAGASGSAGGPAAQQGEHGCPHSPALLRCAPLRPAPSPVTRRLPRADASNAFFRLCKYLGRCSFSDPRSSAVLLVSAE